MTLKLGIIGTSWITAQFIEAALQTGEYMLHSVYSRTEQKATNFLADLTVPNDVNIVTEMAALWADIDVVYIASPNALHYEQAMAAIQHDVHVIVEKPATSNPAEFKRIMTTLADHPTVKYLEAARHIHQPNMATIKNTLADWSGIDGATFFYQKYSSKFDSYLAGENPNIFTREFSGGALYDLGVYTVYAALYLFGKPTHASYQPVLLANGVDIQGTAVLNYDKFNVTLIFGKNSNSYAPSEIYGGKQTIVVDNIAELGEVAIMDAKGQSTVISQSAENNPMVSEAADFAAVLQDPMAHEASYQTWLTLATDVNDVMMQLRESAGLVFPADAKA